MMTPETRVSVLEERVAALEASGPSLIEIADIICKLLITGAVVNIALRPL